MALYRTYKNGGYSHLQMGSPEWDSFFRGASVRFGAYGNPSHLPLEMIENIANLSVSHTGYFHDWNIMPVPLAKAYGKYFMASCEPSNVAFAQNLGLRTFTVVPEAPSDNRFGIECLADKSGLQCIDCGLCDGNSRSANRSLPLPSVWIKAHGYQTEKAIANLN